MSLSEAANRFNSFAHRLLYNPWPNPTIPAPSEWAMRTLPGCKPPRQHFDSVPEALITAVLHDCGGSAAATIAELLDAGMWTESKKREWREWNWVIEGGRKFRIYRAVPKWPIRKDTGTDGADERVLHLEISDASTFGRSSDEIEPLQSGRPFYDLTQRGRDEAVALFRPPLIDERVEFCGLRAAAIVQSLRAVADEFEDEPLRCFKAPLAEWLHSASIAIDFKPRIAEPLAAIRELLKLAADVDWYAFLSAVSNDCSTEAAIKGLHIPAARDAASWRKLTTNLRAIVRVAAAPMSSAAPASSAPSTTVAASGTSDLVSIRWLRLQVPQSKVRGTASHLAGWLRRQGVEICKRAGKNYTERSALLRVFRAGSQVHQLLTEHADDRH